MRVIGVVAGVCAVALAVVGCGETVTGSGAPTTSAAGVPLSKEQLFDPCTLPDSVIAATGADPATKDTKPFGRDRERFVGCKWRADKSDERWGHYMLVSATSYTMADYRANGLFHDFKDVQIRGRRAVQSYVGTENPPVECDIAFESTKGVISVSTDKFVDSKTSTDPCTFATRAAEQIAASLPE
ncbi:DUF3558 domain-containing protein [Nocardia thailandica]|uniref:DUF3558 domain-containing protein n=1 Tax=Nocardia thailandica TaxID=257275 RepID=UPI000316143A|nr:DUF3558 domain-containing protein [Nocardia thailandica]